MSSELRGLRQQHKGLTLRKLISTKKLIYTTVFSCMHLLLLLLLLEGGVARRGELGAVSVSGF